ncbi:hypothetical protein B7P25_18990 [Bacillus thuringiensis]|uniref:Uncharacterized protein n=1 Tax=Bacillus anthracis TaxID=1392 RepID=A0A0J1KVL5_BACAN|nr:hypothetical protein B7P25_18990 [Bacillus thuringiensis]ATI53917.1 hypothetical protein CPZ32_27900 [Bacillus cereus]EDX69376.1 hypothetical protein BC059799_3730 [Bacillus cereus NVH0597-99]KLV20750.1 hypothetical protein ABW01_00295 [Bacillus anthracis]OUA96694.1 hypothetical protein BK714_16155 [Bacillus thuringiensis serovar oswaldocruzi]TNO98896.1 hypothetical protein FH038_06300 [Bacillus sp. CD3-1a]
MRKNQVISKIRKELNVLSRNELVLSTDNSRLFVRIFHGFTKININTTANFCNRLYKPVKIGEIIDYLYC